MFPFDRYSEMNRRNAEELSLYPPEDGRDESPNHACECCGEYPWEDYLYRYNNELICADCLLSKFEEVDVTEL